MARSAATLPVAPTLTPQRLPLVAVGAVSALLLAYVAATYGPRLGALLVVGGLLGVTLYHAAFGFTSAFRVMFSDGRTAGLRAQMAMLALGCLLFFPVLAHGSFMGMPVKGDASPIGVALLVGAVVFGVGMQLASGCASGTLYTVGGGSGRMLVVLAAFVAGSAIGTAHAGFWYGLPHLAPISMVTDAPGGWIGGLAIFLAVFAGVAWVAARVERRRRGGTLAPIASAMGAEIPALTRLVRGPWPLLWGALALAVLNFATLLLAGKPWGVTSAFALWGAKGAAALGLDPASWAYWQGPRAAALATPVLGDVTSVMDLGIILGAMLASILAGRFRPSLEITGRSLAAAVAGGLMLGYGARLALGCNIGAYFSGLVSGSLSGWAWLAAALVGNYAGVRLRPLFGLAVERTPVQAGGC